MLWAAAGCVNEEPKYVEPVDPETTASTGYLSLSDVGLYVVLDSDTDQSTEEPSASMLTRADGETGTTDPTTGGETTLPPAGQEATTKEDYMVTIRSEKGDVVFHDTFDELKKRMNKDKGGYKVPVGEYTISATSNLTAAGVPGGVQASPSYGGQSEVVSVGKDEVKQVETIVCKLQNIKITVSVAADLYEQLEALDESGKLFDAEVYYKEDRTISWTEWNWASETPTTVYFPVLKDEDALHFSFSAKIKGTDSPITIDRDISGLIEGQWRRIHVIPQYPTEGNLVFGVEVSTFAQDETITVGDEKNPEGDAVSMCWMELAHPDDPSMAAPSIKWADGSELPETISADSPALQQVTIAAPNRIERIGLTVRTNNPEFKADAADMTKTDLCAVTSNYRQLTKYGIPFGAALKGQSSVSFGLDKILEQIRGYAGEYTFAFTVIDQSGLFCEPTLRFVCGGASAAAPTIEWATGKLFDDDGFNPDGTEKQNVKYVDMYDGMQIDIELVADPHFESIAVKISSEILNADELGSIGLPAEFDLCNLQAFDYDGKHYTADELGKTFKGLGFVTKVDDELKAEKEVTFSISEFVPMLMGFPGGKFQFALTVEDAEGRSTTKYLRLQSPAE